MSFLDSLHFLLYQTQKLMAQVAYKSVDSPRGADCLNVNRGAVVEDSLRVELEGNGLNAVNSLSLVVADVVAIEAVFASGAQGGEADSGGDVAGATERGEVFGGVAALGQNVEVRADCGNASAELATLLEGGAVLLIDLEVLDNFLGTRSSLAVNLLVRAATAGSEQADGAQGNGAGQQGTAVNT